MNLRGQGNRSIPGSKNSLEGEVKGEHAYYRLLGDIFCVDNITILLLQPMGSVLCTAPF
jgi:hypothetical protein